MKKSKSPGRNFHFTVLLFMAGFYCLLPIDSTAQKITTEPGPFERYGGKREITYDKNNLPIQRKQYDVKNNLRRLVTAS